MHKYKEFSQKLEQPEHDEVGRLDNSQSSIMCGSAVASYGSIDGFGRLMLSSADISSPLMESRESRVQLAKKLGLSYASSMDRIGSTPKTTRRAGNPLHDKRKT